MITKNATQKARVPSIRRVKARESSLPSAAALRAARPCRHSVQKNSTASPAEA